MTSNSKYRMFYRRLTGQWIIEDDKKKVLFDSYSQAEAQRRMCKLQANEGEQSYETIH